MFQPITYSSDKQRGYEQLLKQLDALLQDEEAAISNLANASSLLNQSLTDINWVVFYIWKDNELVLGGFQGLQACIRIPYGKGVCGTAHKEQQRQIIENVHEFPGHIACD